MFRKRNWVIAGATLLLAVVVIAVVVWVMVLRELGEPGEVTADLLPADTQLYFTINLRPGGSQISKALNIKSILESTPGFEKKRDQRLDELQEETGIDIEDDILPWLGRDITFALLDASAEPAEWIVLLQTDDRDASQVFLEDLVEFLEDTEFMEFKRRTRGDALIFNEEFDEISFGLTDDYVLFGPTEDVVREMIRDLESPPSRPLSDDAAFLQIRELVPDERFMLLFIDTEQLIEDALQIASPLGTGFGTIEDSIPDAIVMSGSFIDKGMKLDLFFDTPRASLVASDGGALDISKALPEDTLLLMSLTGVQEGWKLARESISDSDDFDVRGFGDLLDDALDDLEDTTGIDLETEVIDELIGAIALAWLPGDLQFEQSGILPAIEALFLAELGNTRGMEELMEELTGILEDEVGLDVRRDRIGPFDAVAIDLGELGAGIGDFSPGYMFTDDMWVVGTTEDSLFRVADTIGGAEKSLKSNPEFRRLSALTPKDPSQVIFADVAGIIETVVDSLPRDDRREFDDEARPFVDRLHSFFAGAGVSEETTHLSFVLTVRE